MHAASASGKKIEWRDEEGCGALWTNETSLEAFWITLAQLRSPWLVDGARVCLSSPATYLNTASRSKIENGRSGTIMNIAKREVWFDGEAQLATVPLDWLLPLEDE